MREIVDYIIIKHPDGLKRSDIQDMLKNELGIGESTGGVNRHLKRLRQLAIIDWDQNTYTYKLPRDYDSKEYFIRIAENFELTTDKAYFLSIKLKDLLSPKTLIEIDDYIGHRYDEEMNDNMSKLEGDYKIKEIHVHDDIKRLLKHHNSYVRLRLFKTNNECFINDLTRLEKTEETNNLINAYLKNTQSIQKEIKNETTEIFKIRETLIKHLKDKGLSKKMKFLIRFTLNHIRPSHIYDGMI